MDLTERSNYVKRYVHSFGKPEATQILIDIRDHEFSSVTFADIAPSEELAILLKQLKATGVETSYIDHHLPRKGDFTEQGCAIRRLFLQVATEVEGPRFLISTREDAPSCFSLAMRSMVAKSPYVVAHDDMDGALTAALLHGDLEPLTPKMVQHLAKDADLFDGARQERTKENGMSPLGILIGKAFSGLPAFDKNKPEGRKEAWSSFIDLVIGSYKGDKNSLGQLKEMSIKHEELVQEAAKLANQAEEVSNGWWFVDATKAKRFDLATFTNLVGGLVRIVRKSSGPIAAFFGGIQYSLESECLDLPSLAKKIIGLEPSSDPSRGFIGNIPQRIHLSQDLWEKLLKGVISGAR